MWPPLYQTIVVERVNGILRRVAAIGIVAAVGCDDDLSCGYFEGLAPQAFHHG